jgi:hypothetical protein
VKRALYFKANIDAAKFWNAPLMFLEELEELFKSIVVMGSHVITVNEALKWIYNEALIDPELLRKESVITTLEGRGEEEEVFNKDSTEDKSPLFIE